MEEIVYDIMIGVVVIGLLASVLLLNYKGSIKGVVKQQTKISEVEEMKFDDFLEEDYKNYAEEAGYNWNVTRPLTGSELVSIINYYIEDEDIKIVVDAGDISLSATNDVNRKDNINKFVESMQGTNTFTEQRSYLEAKYTMSFKSKLFLKRFAKDYKEYFTFKIIKK